MLETAPTHLFSALCGQNPDHTWSPVGSSPRPVASGAWGCTSGRRSPPRFISGCGRGRPRGSSKRMGCFSSLTVPSRPSLDPPGPGAPRGSRAGCSDSARRAFSCGCRFRPGWRRAAPAGSPIVYPAVLAATLALTPLLGRLGGAGAVYALAALAAAGAGVLLASTLADLVLAFALLSRGAQPAGQN